MANKKRKGKNNALLAPICFFLICFLGGILLGMFGERILGNKHFIWMIGEVLVYLFLGLYIQMIFHEAGHLILGLASGYEFVSFRIGSFMLVKTQEGIKLKRYSLAGTGGQCLLSPPELREGEYPFMLYNLGGVLLNLFVSLAAMALFFTLGGKGHGAAFCITLTFVGIYLALMNGLPLRVQGIYNDGKNIQVLKKSSRARLLLWRQLRVNAELAKGARLINLPEEWFQVPGDWELKDGITAASACLLVSRKMEERDFAGAEELGKNILESAGLLDIHRYMLRGEMAFLALLRGEKENLEWMEEKNFQKFMKLTRNYPSTLRLRYTCALLKDGDEEGAGKIKAEFEKMALSYPNQGEIEGEMELILLAQEKKSA